MPPVAAIAGAIGSAVAGTAAGVAAVAAPVVGAITSVAPVVVGAVSSVKTLVDVIGGKEQTPAPTPATTPAATADSTQEAIAQAQKISGQLADVLEQQKAGTAQPVIYTTSAPAQAAPNYLLYIGIAILAFVLLRKK